MLNHLLTRRRAQRRRPRPLFLEMLEDRLCLSTWSEPVNLGPVINCEGCDNRRPGISSDGLSLYFSSNRPGGLPDTGPLWVSQRASVHDPWGEPQELGPAINDPSATKASAPNLSRDQHWLFFHSNRTDLLNYGGFDIYASYRQDVHDDFAWQTAINLGEGVNSQYDDAGPTYFEDATTGITTLYFTSFNRPGGLGDWDVYASTLQGFANFGPAVLVPELSSPYRDTRTAIRSDGLEMFITSNRPGSIGNLDIWVSTRESTLDRWSTPEDLGAPINIAGFDTGAPALSSDGNTMYFYSNRPGSIGADDLWMSTRLGSFTTLDPPGSTSTNGGGSSINDSGQIVSGYTDAGGAMHGYLFSAGSFTTFDVPNATFTAGNAINNSGHIVGRYGAGGATHGFLLIGNSYTRFDVPGSTITIARAINDADQIVGRCDVAGVTYGFLRIGDSYTIIQVPGSTSTRTFGINNSGHIVGDYIDAGGTNHGFLLSGDSFTTVDVPGGTYTEAVGINDAGQIVGVYIDAAGIHHGYLLSDGVYTTLDPPGATDTVAQAINSFGDISGRYTDASGTIHGFVLSVHNYSPAPTVQSVVINDGSAQRSMVNGLTVSFSTVVTIDAGAFELLRQGGGSFDVNVAASTVAGHTVATLTFSGPGIIGGSLADGNYTLTIHGGLVHDDFGQALDGAGTGVAGTDHVDTFFRLFGDSDGDGHVDLQDLLRFSSTFGKDADDPGFLWYFDYNGDGRVDLGDLFQLLARFGR
jgi:hypothetical protein